MGWNADRLAVCSSANAGLVAVHQLARDAAPGALHDLDGQAFARLGVDGAAQYLARPDGHVGYRTSGTDLSGLERYLALWLPGA